MLSILSVLSETFLFFNLLVTPGGGGLGGGLP